VPREVPEPLVADKRGMSAGLGYSGPDFTRASLVTAQVREQVDVAFTYQPWNEGQVANGVKIREALSAAFLVIIDSAPPCPTRTRALNKLLDARMLANAAITHGGRF
jgi:hypothetical protein